MSETIIYHKTLKFTPSDIVTVQAEHNGFIAVHHTSIMFNRHSALVLDSQETDALITALCEARDALWAETQALDEVDEPLSEEEQAFADNERKHIEAERILGER